MTMEPEVFSHGIVIDSHIWLPRERGSSFTDPQVTHKLHPTQADCAERFRLVPLQPEAMDALLQCVGYHSCISGENGWHWKFDPKVRTTDAITDTQLLTHISVKVYCIYGERSIYNKANLPQQVIKCFPNLVN